QGGDAGGQRVADRDAGGGARPGVAHDDGVGGRGARDRRRHAVGLGHAHVVLRGERVGVGGAVVAGVGVVGGRDADRVDRRAGGGGVGGGGRGVGDGGAGGQAGDGVAQGAGPFVDVAAATTQGGDAGGQWVADRDAGRRARPGVADGDRVGGGRPWHHAADA